MKAAWALGGLIAAEFLVSAAVYAGFDHVSYLLALYWAAETATTVGYGDVTPRTAGAHVVAVVTMLTVIPTVGVLFGRAAAIHTIRVWHRKNAEAGAAATVTADAALASAQAAHQIAADLYEAQTGAVHPCAPDGGT